MQTYLFLFCLDSATISIKQSVKAKVESVNLPLISSSRGIVMSNIEKLSKLEMCYSLNVIKLKVSYHFL